MLGGAGNSTGSNHWKHVQSERGENQKCFLCLRTQVDRSRACLADAIRLVGSAAVSLGAQGLQTPGEYISEQDSRQSYIPHMVWTHLAILLKVK